MYYMGIDHHKQYSHITVMDEKGSIIKADCVLNKRRKVENFLFDIGNEQLEAVIESGRSSYTMVDLLEDLGVKVKIAHPLQVKAIAQAKIKTDKRDSKILAHLLRSDLIPEVWRRSSSNRQAQRVLRHRMSYVKMQTRIKNQIRVLLSKQNEEIREMVEGGRALFSNSGMEGLRKLKLPGKDKDILEALIRSLEHTRAEIKQSDALVKKLYSESPQAQLIITIPGFGTFLSVLVTTEIADIERFSSDSRLHSYAGLVPSIYDTGQRSYHGRLVHQGNKHLRWAVVEAVWPAVRADCGISMMYQRIARRKGANSAKIATARRLLTIIYRMLKEKRSYEFNKVNDSAAFLRN
jgi:transposase